VPAARFSPKGPRDPPECWKTQPFAHCWALLAKLSLQLRGEAPCWARTELCADKYWSISLLDVEPELDPDPVLETELDADPWVLEGDGEGAGGVDKELGFREADDVVVVFGGGGRVDVGGNEKLDEKTTLAPLMRASEEESAEEELVGLVE